jgi:hypothetical protein
MCQNPLIKNLGQLDLRFLGLRQPIFSSFSRDALEASIGGYFCFLFFSFADFDPVSVTMSSMQFVFHIFFINLRLLLEPRANRIMFLGDFILVQVNIKGYMYHMIL